MTLYQSLQAQIVRMRNYFMPKFDQERLVAAFEEHKEILTSGLTQGKSITHLMKKYRSTHLDRVGTGYASPLSSLIYTDILNAYRRIKDHAFNIVEVLSGEK